MEIEKFKKYLKRQGLSNSTVESYCCTLRLFEREGFKWTFEDICKWKEIQMQNHKPGTVNIRIHALNKYAEYSKARWRLKPVKVQMVCGKSDDNGTIPKAMQLSARRRQPQMVGRR